MKRTLDSFKSNQSIIPFLTFKCLIPYLIILLLLTGCNSSVPAATRPTPTPERTPRPVEQIKKDIARIGGDDRIAPNDKARILGFLKMELDSAQNHKPLKVDTSSQNAGLPQPTGVFGPVNPNH